MLLPSDTINFHPEPRTLRQFAAAWLVLIGGLSSWRFFSHGAVTAGIATLLLGITVGGLGLASPRLIRVIYVGAMVVAFPIGWVVSHVLLSVLYFVLFTPIAFFMRILGRDRLRLRRPHENAYETYWTARSETNDMTRYLRQF